MAVQAQYPPSNPFSSDYPSSVIDGIRTMQTDRLPPATKASAGFPNAATAFSDHPQSGLTCNASACRKRRRDEQFMAVPAPAAALPQIPRVSNPSLLAASLGLKKGYSVLPEQSLKVFNSSVTSTSGRPSNVSSELAPAAGWFGLDVDSQICQHDLEMAAFIGLQFDVIRLGVEERRKRHCKSMYSILEQIVIKRFHEKEIELEEAKQKNAELEAKVRQMSAESQGWFNVAKNNELLVSNLKSNLEQILFQNAFQVAVVPPLKEGYGDSDGDPLPVDDEESFFFAVDADMSVARAEPAANLPFLANEVSLQPLICKVCGIDEISVLILPCRHLCLCENCDCDSSVAMCPVCDYPKDSSLQVFI